MELRAVDLFTTIDLYGLAEYYEKTNPKLNITVTKIDAKKSDRLSAWLFRVEKGNEKVNLFLDHATPEEAYDKVETEIYHLLTD